MLCRTTYKALLRYIQYILLSIPKGGGGGGGKSVSSGAAWSIKISASLVHFIQHKEWRDESAITAQNEQAAMKKQAAIMRDIQSSSYSGRPFRDAVRVIRSTVNSEFSTFLHFRTRPMDPPRSSCCNFLVA